jgi:ABC-type lipoprotein release transport system permease subunit
MKRQLALIRFALGSARRRAGRTLALLAALALVTFALSSVLFLTEALRREFRLAATALPDLTVQSLAAGRPALIAEKGLSPIAAIPGVVAVQPRVWGYYFVPSLSGNFTVVGVDTDAASVQRNLSLVTREGKLPRPGASGEVILGESLAMFLALEIGDAITLPVGRAMKRLELVGTFRSQVALWTSDVILMSVADAREFLQVPSGYATDIAVRLSTPDEAGVAARKIAELMPSARIVDRQLMSRTYDLTFDTRGGMMGAMLLPALVAFLVMAWDRFTGVGPGERREIGVLKAVGWRTSDVLIARLWENTVVAVYGAVPGILGAYLYVFYARAPGLAEVLLGWSSIYPVLRLTPAVDLGQVLVLLCFVAVPFVAASLVPAWRTATHDPHGLLRGVT